VLTQLARIVMDRGLLGLAQHLVQRRGAVAWVHSLGRIYANPASDLKLTGADFRYHLTPLAGVSVTQVLNLRLAS
jgi:hypothetical protein